mgnify:CR=1 FL=1
MASARQLHVPCPLHAGPGPRARRRAGAARPLNASPSPGGVVDTLAGRCSADVRLLAPCPLHLRMPETFCTHPSAVPYTLCAACSLWIFSSAVTGGVTRGARTPAPQDCKT